MNYLTTPNRHVLVQLRALYKKGQLSVNDNRLMELYEQLVTGKRRKDAKRIVDAAAVLLQRKGITEVEIGRAAAAQAKRLGARGEAPTATPPGADRKKILAVLQSATGVLQPSEQEMVETYVAVLGGQRRMPPAEFRLLEQAIEAVYRTVSREVIEDSQSVSNALRDTHVAGNTQQQLQELEHSIALLVDEDDISYVQGLLMSEQMGLLELTPDMRARVDKLYRTVIHRSELSAE
jgi:hypothetical protein